MADAQERWRQSGVLAPFLTTPSPPQRVQPAAEDRSWMPRPSTAPGNVDWHKNWQHEWSQATQWAQKNDQAFHARLQAAESALSGLERSARPFDPRIAPARATVSKLYTQLNARYDAHLKTLPFTRY